MISIARQCYYIAFFTLFLLPGRGFPQTEWYDYYTRAEDAIEQNRWETAIGELNKALEKKPQPQLGAETPGLKFVNYIPYYWRGFCYYNLGDFEKARVDFNTSLLGGAVKKTEYLVTLQNYLRQIERMTTTADSINVLKHELGRLRKNDENANAEWQKFTEIENAFRRGDTLTAKKSLQEMKVNFPNNPAIPTLEKLLQPSPAKSSSLPETPSKDPYDELFEEGLNFYLDRKYQLALDRFQRIAGHSPAYRRVNEWIRKTEEELQRLGQELFISPDTVTLTQTITFFDIPKSTREDSILLSGSVRHDKGIRYVEFTLNGQNLMDERGEVLHRAPTSPEEAESLEFNIKIPLQMGNNEIVVTAHNIGGKPQIEERIILRKPPLHQTPEFYITIAVILLLAAGSGVANEMIKRRIAFVDKYNPYIAGAPVRNEKMFFGRENLVRRLINNLHNNSLMIYGPRRIGKTSLLHQLKQKLEKETDGQYHYVPVYIDLQGTPEEKFFAVLMHDIYEGCEAHFRQPLPLRILETAPEYSARDFSSDIKQIITALQAQLRKPFKLVLLIDEVDELNSYSERVNQKLRSIFMKTFAENLVAVMSGTHIRKRWESEGSPWYNFFEEIEVRGIERKFSEELIRTPVRGIFRYDDEAVDKIIEYSDNIPYRIQKFCVNAISRVIEGRRRKVTVEDIEEVKKKVLESEEEE